MSAIDAMIESRRRIMLKHGEFNPIILRLKLVEDASEFNIFKTGYTDGKRLAFHPDLIAGLDHHQRDTFFIHEALHVALLHTFSQRIKWLVPEEKLLANVAMDHVVNNIALEAGFSPLPSKYWLCDQKYIGWTWEAVFEDLKQQAQQQQKGKGQPGQFDLHPEPGDENQMTAEEKAEYAKLKKEWQKSLADMVTIAKQKGTLGAGLEKLVNEALESVIPWPQILVDNLTRRLGHMDYTWTRPSRRGRSLGMYLPSSYDLQVDCVVFCFDTSGSMWDDPLLPQGFAEMKAVCQRMKVKRMILIEADAEVAREREIEDATALSTDIKGGGGTHFGPALERAAGHEPNLI